MVTVDDNGQLSRSGDGLARSGDGLACSGEGLAQSGESLAPCSGDGLAPPSGEGLAPGWRRGEDGAIRREVKPSMTRRKTWWDYQSPAIYEINMVLVDRRRHSFGEVVVDAVDDTGLPTAAHCELTAAGRVVADCFEAIERFHPEIKVIGKQVMPEHFHGLLWVKSRLAKPLGVVINGFKAGCRKGWRVPLSAALRPSKFSRALRASWLSRS